MTYTEALLSIAQGAVAETYNLAGLQAIMPLLQQKYSKTETQVLADLFRTYLDYNTERLNEHIAQLNNRVEEYTEKIQELREREIDY